MKIKLMSLVALAVVMLGLNAQTAKADDAAGPKAVVAKFAKAFMDKDLKAAQSCIEDTKEGNQVFIEGLKDMMGVVTEGRKLKATLTKKFGEQGGAIAANFPSAEMFAGEFNPDKMTFKVAADGKSAKAWKTGDEDDPTTLVKTAKGWKIDVMSSTTEDELLEMLITMAVLNMAMGEMNVAAENAETFEAFIAELQTIGAKMQEAMAEAMEAAKEEKEAE